MAQCISGFVAACRPRRPVAVGCHSVWLAVTAADVSAVWKYHGQPAGQLNTAQYLFSYSLFWLLQLSGLRWPRLFGWLSSWLSLWPGCGWLQLADWLFRPYVSIVWQCSDSSASLRSWPCWLTEASHSRSVEMFRGSCWNSLIVQWLFIPVVSRREAVFHIIIHWWPFVCLSGSYSISLCHSGGWYAHFRYIHTFLWLMADSVISSILYSWNVYFNEVLAMKKYLFYSLFIIKWYYSVRRLKCVTSVPKWLAGWLSCRKYCKSVHILYLANGWRLFWPYLIYISSSSMAIKLAETTWKA